MRLCYKILVSNESNIIDLSRLNDWPINVESKSLGLETGNFDSSFYDVAKAKHREGIFGNFIESKIGDKSLYKKPSSVGN